MIGPTICSKGIMERGRGSVIANRTCSLREKKKARPAPLPNGDGSKSCCNTVMLQFGWTRATIAFCRRW